MERALVEAATVVVDLIPISGVLARWWKTIGHLGRRQITPVYINFCCCTAAVVLMWGDCSRAQEDGGLADDPTTVTSTAENDGGVDEKEEASSPAVGENAKIAKTIEGWFLVALGGLLVLVLLVCCTLNIYRKSSKLQERRLGKDLPGLQLNEETKDWSSTLEARKQQFGIIGTNGASAGVQHQQRGKHSVEAFNYPRITTGVHLSSDIDDLSMIGRSLSLTSVASQGGSAYGQWSNSSSSNNNSKKTNTTKLGADLSDTIFEGDELQGKKAPGEKGDVYRNPMAKKPAAGSEGVLLKPSHYAAL